MCLPIFWPKGIDAIEQVEALLGCVCQLTGLTESNLVE